MGRDGGWERSWKWGENVTINPRCQNQSNFPIPPLSTITTLSRHRCFILWPPNLFAHNSSVSLMCYCGSYCITSFGVTYAGINIWLIKQIIFYRLLKLSYLLFATLSWIMVPQPFVNVASTGIEILNNLAESNNLLHWPLWHSLVGACWFSKGTMTNCYTLSACYLVSWQIILDSWADVLVLSRLAGSTPWIR